MQNSRRTSNRANRSVTHARRRWTAFHGITDATWSCLRHFEFLEDRRLLCSAPEGDDHASLEQTEFEICELPLGESVDGVFHSNSDSDAFRVSITEPGWYEAVVTPAHTVSIALEDRRVFTLRTGRTIWLAETPQDYFVSVRPSVDGDYSLQARLIEDDHADEISPELAGLTTETTGQGELEVPGDVDTFSIPVVAGEMYRLRAQANTSSISVDLDATGESFAFNRYSRGEWLWRAPYTGLMYASVSSNSSSDRFYDLHLQIADDEPSSANTTAHLLDDSYVDANIELPGDVDWFAFDADPNFVYRFQTVSRTNSDEGSPLPASRMRIFDPSGHNEVAPTWTYGPSELLFHTETPGRYYVAVQGYGGGTGLYRLVTLAESAASVLTAPPPDGTFTLVPESAVPLVTTHDASERLMTFYVPTPGAFTYDIQIRPETVGIDSVRIVDENDATIASASSLRWGSDLRLSVHPATSTATIEVETAGDVGTFEVSIAVRQDDHPNEPSTITSPLSADRNYAGEILGPDDRDALAFELEPSTYYRVNSMFQTSRFEGTIRAQGLEGLGNASRYINAVGRATTTPVTLEFLDQSSPALYFVSLEEIPDDYPDEVSDDAVYLTFDSQTQGSVGHRQDTDLLAFDAVNGDAYVFQVDGPVTADLISPSGQETRLTEETRWTTFETGTYFVRITGFGSADYSVLASRILGDDHANNRDESAAVIEPNSTFIVTAETSNDVDVLAFDATAGQGFVVTNSRRGRGTLTLYQAGNDQALRTLFLSRDVRLDYFVQETGRYYLQWSDLELGDYEVSVELPEDDHPSLLDQRDMAQTVQAGEAISGEYEVGGDIDIFRFETIGNEWFEFTDARQNGFAQPSARLYDANGAEVEFHANRTWRSPAPGTYYIAVSGPAREYEWSFIQELDEYSEDPDPDSPGQSGRISGRISTRFDRDYIPVDLEQGTELIVDANVSVFLQDADGRSLTSGNQFQYASNEEQRLYLRISGSARDYELVVAVGQDPSSIRSEKSPTLLPDTPYFGSASRTDRDAFRFELAPGQKAGLVSGISSLDMDVYDETNNRIVATGTTPTWTATEGGVFSVVVKGFSSAASLYALVLQTKDADEIDDHPDFPADEAAALLVDEPQTGVLTKTVDVDTFSIDVVRGEINEFDVVGDPSEVRIETVDGYSIRLLQNNFRWKAPETGRYFVSIRDRSLSETDTFEITRLQLQTDDHSDVPGATATPIEFGVPIAVDLDSDFIRDVDVFSFVAEEGRLYRIAPRAGRSISIRVRGLDPEYSSPLAFQDLLWVAPSSGTFYIELANEHAEFDLVVEEIIDDQPDEFAAATTILSPESAIEGRLHDTSDIDWFRISAAAGAYQLQIIPSDDTPLRYGDFRILEDDHEIVAFNNNDRVWFHVRDDSEYGLRLTGSRGDYRFQLAAVDDDFPNEPSDRVTILAENERLGANLESPIDADVFGVDVPPRTGVVLQVFSGTLNANDVQLRLFDSNGQVVSGPSVSPLRYVVDQSERYFVEIASPERRATGRYDVLATFEEVEDDHGSNFADATPVTLPAEIDAQFEFVNDRDVFSFNIEAPNTGLRIGSTSGTVPATEVQWQLLDGEGNPLPRNSLQTGQGGTYKFQQPGTYYVAATTSQPGSYSTSLQLLDDDHPDTIDSVDVSDVTNSVLGTIEAAFDADVFRLTVEPLEVLHFAPNGDVELRVFDAQGVEIQGDNPWKFFQAGTYYLSVSSQTPNNYSVSIGRSFDDHGDFRENATPLVHRQSISGTLGSRDTDYFVVNGVQGTLVTAVNFSGNFAVPSWEDASGNPISTTNIGAKFPQAGAYYFRVSQLVPSTVSRDYSFQMFVIGDLPEGPSENTFELERNSQFNLLAYPGDKDTYAISLNENETASIRVSPAGMGLQIMSLDGTELASGTSTVDWKATQAGRYYLVLDPHDDVGGLAYPYEIDFDVAADDAPDQISENTFVIRADSSRWLNFTNSEDTDVVAFPVERDEWLRVNLFTSSQFGFRTRVLDENGQVLAESARTTFDWKAPATGTYYVAISPRGNNSIASNRYRIDRLQLPQDDWPDAPQPDANAVSLEESFVGAFQAPSADRDVLAVDLPTEGKYRLEFLKRLTDAEPPTELPLGLEVLQSDGASTVPTRAIDLSWTITDPGRHYLAIDAKGTTGSYEARVVAVPDDYPDSAETATTFLSFDDTLDGSLEIPSDLDFFRLSLDEPTNLRVDATAETFTPVVSIGSAESLQTMDSPVLQRLTPGEYSVGVSGGTGDFTIQLGRVVDDVPNEIDEDAIVLPLATERAGTLEVLGDRDIYRIDVPIGTTLFVEASQTEFASTLQLIAEDGTVLTTNRSSVTAKIRSTPVFVGIEAPSVGSYTITATAIGDDHSDLIDQTATPLSIDEEINGQLELSGDVDAFQMDLGGGKSYEATIVANRTPPPFRWHDVDGTLISRSVNSQLFLQPPQDGTYFLSATTGITGSTFVVSVNEIDDDRPSVPTADTLELSEETAVTLTAEFPGDKDVVAFRLNEGQAAIVTSEGSTNQGFLSVLDQNGDILVESFSPGIIFFQAEQDGTYYLRHESNEGQFQLSMQIVAAGQARAELRAGVSAKDVDNFFESLRQPGYCSELDHHPDGSLDWQDALAFLDRNQVLLGDANLDARVDFEDFLILSSRFGQNGNWSQGDFSGDGEVDFEDFLWLSQAFGNSDD